MTTVLKRIKTQEQFKKNQEDLWLLYYENEDFKLDQLSTYHYRATGKYGVSVDIWPTRKKYWILNSNSSLVYSNTKELYLVIHSRP